MVGGALKRVAVVLRPELTNLAVEGADWRQLPSLDAEDEGEEMMIGGAQRRTGRLRWCPLCCGLLVLL